MIDTTSSAPEQLRALADLIEAGDIPRADIDVHFHCYYVADPRTDGKRVVSAIAGTWVPDYYGSTHWISTAGEIEYAVFTAPELIGELLDSAARLAPRTGGAA